MGPMIIAIRKNKRQDKLQNQIKYNKHELRLKLMFTFI